jgi:hypothetical protein
MRLPRFFAITLTLLTATMVMADNFSTPENALRALEDAYVRKDIDAAVAAKDFQFEARAMLSSMKSHGSPDEALVKQTAEVLELAFRKQIKEQGFPDFASLRCKVTQQRQVRDGLVEMVEECVYPDGGKSSDKLHAARSSAGWRIVILP